MCGVFGFIGIDGAPLNVKRLRDIAVDTMSRGPHAFGFAWIDKHGHLRCFKQEGRIKDHLGLLAMAKDARMLIGHCRYATHGDPENNLNNHPHACDGGWLIHNGVVGDHGRLAEEHDLYPVTDCDSEILALLIERYHGKLLNRCIAAVNETASSPLVIAGLWARAHQIVIVRRGNPLYRGEDKRGGHYFSSCNHALPRGWQSMPNNSAELWRVPGLVATAKLYRSRRPVQRTLDY